MLSKYCEIYFWIPDTLNPIKFLICTSYEIRKLYYFSYPADPEGPGICAHILTACSFLLFLVTMPFSLFMCVKVILSSPYTTQYLVLQVVQEYERAVIFRLGRLRAGGAKGPGLFFTMPCIDSYKTVDLRTVSFDVPPQEVDIHTTCYRSRCMESSLRALPPSTFTFTSVNNKHKICA